MKKNKFEYELKQMVRVTETGTPMFVVGRKSDTENVYYLSELPNGVLDKRVWAFESQIS